ncbi:DUF3047 domain-containing protein [uncultured Piscinibacter sp.]|uniref:DUF3047 domain-containing protein n=1 Tax=uncultured Piscinibacter sp. TaxID=1131835 RepID=UPI0026081299|nr:DUF3047 domain-containing protein [uncultured Piscinibacter sp.]
MSFRPPLAAATLLAALAVVPARATLLQPLIGADGELSSSWEDGRLPKQRLPATRFGIAELGGQRALRIEADGSYGNLVHRLRTDAFALMLSWRWRVERFVAQSNLRRKEGDDNAVKVCMFFELPLADVPFVERQLLRLARSRSGEELPSATVCYVWDRLLPAGTALDNPYSRRVRYLVLQSGGAGRWASERRDVGADFLRLFGDEAEQVPPVVGVAVGADADNTRGHGLAAVADLVLDR